MRDEQPLVWPVALGGMAALAVAMGIGRFAFTPLLPMMERDSGLSLTDGGWLASANYLGYLLGALSAVWLRIAPARMVRVGLLLTAVLTFAMGLTQWLPFWLLLRGAGGVASAWVMVYAAAWALPLLSRWNRTAWSGVVFGGVGAGIALVGLFGLALEVRQVASGTVWRLLGGAALLLSLGVWGATEHGGTNPPAARTVPTGLAWTPYMRCLTVCYGVFGFGYIIPATFLPVMARHAVPDPRVVGVFWPAFGLAALLSTLGTPFLSARFRDQQVLAGAFALQAVGVGAVAISTTVAGTGLCALLVGGTFMVITMQGLREARRLAGASASRLMGVMTAAFAVGQIIGPLYATALVHWTGRFEASLLTAAVLMALSAMALGTRRDAAEQVARV